MNDTANVVNVAGILYTISDYKNRTKWSYVVKTGHFSSQGVLVFRLTALGFTGTESCRNEKTWCLPTPGPFVILFRINQQVKSLPSDRLQRMNRNRYTIRDQ